MTSQSLKHGRACTSVCIATIPTSGRAKTFSCMFLRSTPASSEKHSPSKPFPKQLLHDLQFECHGYPSLSCSLFNCGYCEFVRSSRDGMLGHLTSKHNHLPLSYVTLDKCVQNVQPVPHKGSYKETLGKTKSEVCFLNACRSMRILFYF